MVGLSPSEMRDSDVPRPCSSLPFLEWNLQVSTRPRTTQSWSAMRTPVRSCAPTLSQLADPQCFKELPSEFRRKSLAWHRQRRSKSLLLQLTASYLHGSEDQFWHPWTPSSPCGLQRKNMKKLVPLSLSANVFSRDWNVPIQVKLNKMRFKFTKITAEKLVSLHILFGNLCHTAVGAAKERWPSVLIFWINRWYFKKNSIVSPYFIENTKRIEANN